MQLIKMFFFKKKPKSFLGIDVGASAVKIVELNEEGGRRKLTNYAIAPLADYLEKTEIHPNGKFPDISHKEIAKVIRESVKEAKIVVRDAYFSIPVYSSFSILIDFPDIPEKEIAAAIPLEARKHIPVPISELVLEWSIINSPGKKSGHQALVIAVPKKVIGAYNQISKLTGLTLRGIEEETFSLSRALVGNDKSVVILLDVGARSINISIVDGGYIRIIHNLEMGGIKVTQAIARQMSFGLEEAEQFKKEMLPAAPPQPAVPAKKGLSADGAALQAGERLLQLKGIGYSTLGAIITEVRKIIEAYQTKYSRKIEKCILVGDGIRLSGFADYLTTKLNIDVALGNPFARAVYPSAIEPILKEIGPPLAVAMGLAMRE